MSQGFCLKIVKGPSPGRKFNFKQNAINIGRSSVDNDLVLNNQSVSVHHARISFASGTFFLQDMGSTNGTTINGQLIQKHDRVELENDAEICFGSICLQFSTEADEPFTLPTSEPVEKTIRIKAPKKPSLPKKNRAPGIRKKPVLIVARCVVILFVVLIVFNSIDFSSSSSNDSGTLTAGHSNEPIPLPAEKVYGYLPSSGIDSNKDKILYCFNENSGSMFLHYTPGFINSANEVAVSLNGTKIGNMPITGDVKGGETVVYLPRHLLVGGNNILEFDNTMNPPGESTWGIKSVFIKTSTEFSCDTNEA